MDTDEQFEEVWAAGLRWQRLLRRRWSFLPDVDAELRAIVWEQFAAGVEDQTRLFSTASAVLRRLSRQEHRYHRVIGVLSVVRPVDESADWAHLLDIRRTLEQNPIPARSIPWVTAIVHGAPCSRNERAAGRRWAKTIQAEMQGHLDVVA